MTRALVIVNYYSAQYSGPEFVAALRRYIPVVDIYETKATEVIRDPALVKAILRGSYNYVFLFSTGLRLSPEDANKPRGKTALVGLDFSYRTEMLSRPTLWKSVDFYLPNSAALARLARRAGVSSRPFYPFIDPAAFSPEFICWPDKTHDVIAAGRFDHSHPDGAVRTEVIRRLRSQGLSVRVTSGMTGTAYAEALAGARFGLHLKDSTCGVARKLLEYGAAGVCPISNVTEDTVAVLEPGKEMLDADAPDLFELMRRGWECRKIAKAARSRCLRDHTADRRVAEVLEFLGAS